MFGSFHSYQTLCSVESYINKHFIILLMKVSSQNMHFYMLFWGFINPYRSSVVTWPFQRSLGIENRVIKMYLHLFIYLIVGLKMLSVQINRIIFHLCSLISFCVIHDSFTWMAFWMLLMWLLNVCSQHQICKTISCILKLFLWRIMQIRDLYSGLTDSFTTKNV